MFSVLLACLVLLAVPAVAMEPLYGGFSAPTGIAAGKDGSLYVSNWGSGTVERIAPDGTRCSVFMDTIQAPAGIAVDDGGAVYVAAYSGNAVHRMDIVTDGADAVLVVDNGANAVRRLRMDGSSQTVLSGMAGSAVALGRAASGAVLVGCWGSGNIYVIGSETL